MDFTLAGPIIIALIGGIFGILGGSVAGRQQGRQQLELQHKEWLLGREDDLAQETRLAVAELTRTLALATHSIVWLAWKAKFRPDQLTQNDILKYDEESHGMIPQIVGSLTIVSALNSEIYDDVVPLVHSYYHLEAKTGFAASVFEDSPEKGVRGIAEIYEEAVRSNRVLEEKVRDVFRIST